MRGRMQMEWRDWTGKPEIDELINEVISSRIERILERHARAGGGEEELERQILDLIIPGKEGEAERLLEQGISRAAAEQQALYREAFRDGLRLGLICFSAAKKGE